MLVHPTLLLLQVAALCNDAIALTSSGGKEGRRTTYLEEELSFVGLRKTSKQAIDSLFEWGKVGTDIYVRHSSIRTWH